MEMFDMEWQTERNMELEVRAIMQEIGMDPDDSDNSSMYNFLCEAWWSGYECRVSQEIEKEKQNKRT